MSEQSRSELWAMAEGLDKAQKRVAELEAETTNWAKTHLQRLDENEAQRVRIAALEQERDYCRKLLGTPDDEALSSHIQFLIARKIQLQATVEAQTQRIAALDAAVALGENLGIGTAFTLQIERYQKRIAELTEAHKDEQATVEVQARRIEQLKAAEKRVAELEEELRGQMIARHIDHHDTAAHGFDFVKCPHPNCVHVAKLLKGGAK